MAIQVTTIRRDFRFMGKRLPDPNPKFSIENVQGILAMQHPAIASALYEVEQKGDVQIITFVEALGKKG